MSSAPVVLRNFLSLGAAQAVTMATGFVTAIVVSRALGPENYGILGFSTALISYFGLLVVLGTDTFATREIARDLEKGPDLAREVLGLRLLLFIVSIGAIALLAALIDQPDNVKAVLLIQGCGMLGAALMLDFYYQGVQRMGIISIRQISAASLSLLAVLALVRAPDDLYFAAAIPVAAVLLTVLGMMVLFLRKAGAPPARMRPVRWGPILRRSLPFAVTSLMVAIYFHMDLVMLGFMRTKTETGWYTVAARLLTVALVLGSMLQAAFLPALAASFRSPRQFPAAEVYIRSVLTVGAPICTFGAIFAGPILVLLFGEAYAGGRAALLILMIASGVGYLVVAFGGTLIAWNGERTYTAAVTAGALLNVVLNLLLIPRFGIVGAATATLTSQTVVAIWLAAAYAARARSIQAATLLRVAACTLPAGLTVGFLPPWLPLELTHHPSMLLLVSGLIFGAIYGTLAMVLGLASVKTLQGLAS